MTLKEFIPKSYLSDDDNNFTSCNVIKVENPQIIHIDTEFEEKFKIDDKSPIDCATTIIFDNDDLTIGSKPTVNPCLLVHMFENKR